MSKVGSVVASVAVIPARMSIRTALPHWCFGWRCASDAIDIGRVAVVGEGICSWFLERVQTSNDGVYDGDDDGFPSRIGCGELQWSKVSSSPRTY